MKASTARETQRNAWLRWALCGAALWLTACGGSAGALHEPARPVPPPKAAIDETPGNMPRALQESPAPAAASGASDASWPFGPAPSTDERTAELSTLLKDADPLRSNWVPPGKSDRYGHAEGLVGASLERVRAKLSDFAHYKELAGPKFKSVRVVDKHGPLTDVYFQLPIMKGLITLWYVTRFAPSRTSPRGDIIEGTFVKGNIDGMHIAFTMRPASDESSTVLTCDLVLKPSIPAPQFALDEELRDACGDAIRFLRQRLSEGSN